MVSGLSRLASLTNVNMTATSFRVQHGAIAYLSIPLHAFTSLHLEEFGDRRIDCSFRRLILAAHSSTNILLLHRLLYYGWRSHIPPLCPLK